MTRLEDLYKEVILDHYRAPRNQGELPTPPAHKVDGFNPLCGDEIHLFLEIEDGVVRDVKISGRGCSISQASASMMGAAIKNKPLEEVRALSSTFARMMGLESSEIDLGAERPKVPLGDLEALQGVVKFPVRVKCATLPWHTMTEGLKEMGLASSPPPVE